MCVHPAYVFSKREAQREAPAFRHGVVHRLRPDSEKIVPDSLKEYIEKYKDLSKEALLEKIRQDHAEWLSELTASEQEKQKRPDNSNN